MAELGNKEYITITLPSGLKIQGVMVVNEIAKRGDKITGIGYTIPNMHFYLQDNKLVKSLHVESGDTCEGNLFTGNYTVNEPLMNIVK